MSGEIDQAELRQALHRVADMIVDYLGNVGDYPVFPDVEPGDVAARLPAMPPEQSASLDQILDDYSRLIEPNVTHWNHPGFMAYFAITGSGPGIVGEALTAALNVNAMLWRTSPAATELEERVCDWLRQMVGLPPEYRGHINDTASISTLLSLGVARHRVPGLEVRQRGLAGRAEVPPLVIYVSDQAHSSCDKAALTLGLGLDNVRHIPVDETFRMSPEKLADAIDRDRAAGRLPMAVVATLGTTVTTSMDPVAEIAEVCTREGVWLHVDAAYAGNAAICPEMRSSFAGWERADSIVLNPHKWLFTPVDCSVLLVRDLDLLRSTFSLVPEYLESAETDVVNLMDLGVQLGRRFRALKLWMVIRAFGVEGLQQQIRRHCRLASQLAGWIDQDERFELAAPVPFSTVCFRWSVGDSPAEADRFNERLLSKVNAEGSIFLSHAVLDERYTLRLTIGNLKTTATHVEQAWHLIQDEAAEITGSVRS